VKDNPLRFLRQEFLLAAGKSPGFFSHGHDSRMFSPADDLIVLLFPTPLPIEIS